MGWWGQDLCIVVLAWLILMIPNVVIEIQTKYCSKRHLLS
jgi:hypothetical protein